MNKYRRNHQSILNTGVYEICSGANPHGCPILQTKCEDPSTHATEAKVHRTNNGKLRADAYLSRNIRTPVKYVPGRTNVSGNACYIWTAPEE